MKTHIIGDIHGCMKPFEKLITALNPDLRQDRLILTGDLIDRGPASADVVRFVRELQAEFGSQQVVALRGNHEQMLLDAALKHDVATWSYNGADATMRSYQ